MKDAAKGVFGNAAGMIRFLIEVYKKQYWCCIIKIIRMLCFAVIGLLPSLLMKIIIDDLMLECDAKEIIVHIMLYALAVLAGSLVYLILRYFDERFTLRIKNNVELDLYHAMMKLPYDEMERYEINQFLVLAEQGKQSVVTVLDDCLSLCSSVIRLILYTTILSSINPVMILVIVLCFAIKTLLDRRSRKKIIAQRRQVAKGKLMGRVISKLFIDTRYGKDIRSLNIGEWLLKKFSDAQDQEDKNADSITRIGVKYRLIAKLIDHFQLLVAYLLTVLEVLTNAIGLGDFVFVLGCITQFSSSLSGILQSYSKVSDNFHMLTEYKKCIRMSRQVGVIQEKKNCDFTGVRIDFLHVCFKYPGSDHYILKDLSFSIKNGEKITIVGENGTGKTTAIKLMCGFYQPDQGTILVNGVPLSELNMTEYYKKIGAVFQDYQIYSMSISDNIIFASSCSDAAPYIEKVGLTERMAKEPSGINTVMSRSFCSDGVDFSGGERQKVAIARALAKEPTFFILDEPTAALDPIAEYEIYKNFKEITKSCTTVFVSHRLSSARLADKIIVLKDGHVVEEGSHDELMHRKGEYARLFNLQAEKYK